MGLVGCRKSRLLIVFFAALPERHHIPAGRQLKVQQLDYVVSIIGRWLVRRCSQHRFDLAH